MKNIGYQVTVNILSSSYKLLIVFVRLKQSVTFLGILY